MTLRPFNSALCYVNGKMMSDETTLKTGSRVIFGRSHVFRFTNPQQGNVLSPDYISYYVSALSVYRMNPVIHAPEISARKLAKISATCVSVMSTTVFVVQQQCN